MLKKTKNKKEPYCHIKQNTQTMFWQKQMGSFHKTEIISKIYPFIYFLLDIKQDVKYLTFYLHFFINRFI